MKLKGFVRTKSHPEGSIAEGYVFDESLTYCSHYLQGCETRFNRKCRTDVPEPNVSTMPFFTNKGRVLRSQTTRDVEEMPCDNIQEDEGALL